MSGKEKTPKSKNKGKKEQKKKRQATSPLFENGHLHENVVNTGEQKTEQKNSQRKKCKADNLSKTVSDFYSNYSLVYDPNMAFQTQGAQFSMPQTQSFSQPQPQSQPYIQSPPPNQMGFGFPVQTAPPPWAAKLLEDIEQIKVKLQCMDKIEKTVNSINAKVCTLETKMNDMDTRLTTNEQACDFVAKEYERNKTEMKTAKDDLKDVQKTCNQLERDSKTMKEKMVDLESRSMRENLMFYGIPEGGDGENCDELVKNVCKDVLKLTDSDRILFDRVHRVGAKTRTKARPIVAKFHYYHERETVRKRAFEYSDVLKLDNKGISAQLPKQLRDARKPLYPAMKRAKEEGKNVRFVGNKLYIEGEEYVEPTPMNR